MKAFHLESIGRLVSGSGIPFAEQFGVMLSYWSFSMYYCLSEVWGTVVVLILFWGVSNRSNTVEEAKRFYSPILLITNLSGLFTSQISLFLSNSSFKYLLFPDQEKWPATLLSITLFVCLLTVGILFLFFLLFRHVKNTQSESVINEKKLSKEEMSLTKIIKLIIQKKTFWPLAIMVFAYFFTSGIIEFIWKYYLQKVYPDSNDFNDYLSLCTSYISVISTFLALGVTGSLIRRFPWQISALVTPFVLLVPVFCLVVSCYFYENDPVLCTFFGACYYSLSRICKFTFFDLSKEVATVEMEYSDQVKSKTILDGLIPKFAKTSESVFLQILLVSFIYFSAAIPFIIILMLALHCFWAYTITENAKTKSILELN